ncbi:Protein phosphatase 2C 32 [Platanthera zijinensis]|uniref:protein-serine/threonine phosphatase n=1 Tax=Platanthera zijinensis TaxID=2320716 RepID=A0AAP0AW52_9ASPA
MGNSTSRVVGCFGPSGNGKDGTDLEFLEPLDEGLGHSFCYVRPVILDSAAVTPSTSDRYTVDSSNLSSEIQSGSFRQELGAEDMPGAHRPCKNLSETTFKTISGASVCANASTARTGGNLNVVLSGDVQEPAATFESTSSFAAIPLQPVPRGSGPLNGFLSGPLERGFASGPLERGAGFMSGPLDRAMFMSGPLDGTDRCNFSAPLGHGPRKAGIRRLVRSMSRPMRSAFSKTFSKHLHGSGWMQRVIVHPVMQFVGHHKDEKFRQAAPQSCVEVGSSEPEYGSVRNLQWAQGKAGEDRVHVVLSEEQGWLFVGIYDGFSGPDAPDFLMSNLYRAIDKELEGLLWDYEHKPQGDPSASFRSASNAPCTSECLVEECMLPMGLCTETKFSDSQSRGDHSNNHCPSEFPILLPSEQNVSESAQCDDTIEGKVQFRRELDFPEAEGVMHQVRRACLEENNAEAAADGHIQDPPSTLKGKSLRTSRKSQRLYELLQMELVEDYKAKESSLASLCRSSGDLPLSSHAELCATGHLAEAQILDCSTSTREERSEHHDLITCVRESEGTLEGSSSISSQSVAPSLSALGQTQMMKKSLVGLKLGKMYMKQKSLRKKLFPWSYDWHRDQHHQDEKMKNPSFVIRRCRTGPVDHDAVLKAMARALEATEEAYSDMVEKELDINPELALMGSCVLVMLMKDQDVYVINLGDSRVVLAQDKLTDCYGNSDIEAVGSTCRNRPGDSLVRMDLERISEDSPIQNRHNHICSINKSKEISLYGLKMRAVQLSSDHSTSIEEEVLRIKAEHPDDPQAILNDRVKGQLKVTRAFGAGFLKKPKFNEELLEMFRIHYIGTSPYLSCRPSVVHHHLCSNDRFLILSSDGLYQYFSNEEVVSHVAWFMENMSEGDPAQYLISELISRAAKKNGMNFHELLDIPHGDRRKYHDDVSVMVISLRGCATSNGRLGN